MSDIKIEKKCYILSTMVKRCEESLVIDALDVRAQDHIQQGSPVKAVVHVML